MESHGILWFLGGHSHMNLKLNGRHFRDCTINGKPPAYEFEELVLGSKDTAFLLVDVYTDPDCGETPEQAPDIGARKWWKVITNISEELEAARSVDIPVIYVTNSSPQIGLKNASFGKAFKRGWNGNIDTAFGEIKYPPSLEPLPNEYKLKKHVYSGFFDSQLDTLLRNKGITTLVMVGFWADVCLLATSLDALYRNYDVIWIRGCTMAGGDPPIEGDWTNTERYIKLFETIIGYSVEKDEFVNTCKKII